MNESAVKNCRILIKNTENGEIIADTKINRFNRLRNSVYINADSLKERKPYTISAFIFAKKALYEFPGTIKGALVGNEIEVLLGKSKEKEDRGQTRYPTAWEGTITAMLIDGCRIQLRKAIHIRTVNMSANGILIKADAGCFDVGNCFSLTLRVENSELRLKCEIVRIQNSTMLTEEYGCRISELWIEREPIQENAE